MAYCLILSFCPVFDNINRIVRRMAISSSSYPPRSLGLPASSPLPPKEQLVHVCYVME